MSSPPDEAVLPLKLHPLKLTAVLDPETYTPPPCGREGHFLEAYIMGSMEWGVTGGSSQPAAASQETRHRVTRAPDGHGVSSWTLLPWGPWNGA